jgi:thymidylate synthase
MGYVEGKSIGEAYIKALGYIKKEAPKWYLTVHISQPILNISREKPIPPLLDITHLLDYINVGNEVYQAFVKFRFPKPDEWTGGKSGKDWINGRIRDLFDKKGYYNIALREGYSFDQLKRIETRLFARNKRGGKLHGSTTNALICQVFMPNEDLVKACSGAVHARRMRCLITLDFKPMKDILNLMAVFRSQYFDTKAYGNFIALAILLYDMCQKTGYKPGAIVSTANKVTFMDNKNLLYKHFRNNGII